MSWAIAGMLERLSRALASQAYEAGLNPAQWAALRYAASANETVRNIAAFAKVHRTTHGSAAQTIDALVAKRLLTKKPGADKRQRVLTVTAKGAALLAEDPLRDIAQLIATLSDDRLFETAEVLEMLTKKVTVSSTSE
jgi:DNA-binding MarR family transcriptional regulator